MFCFFTGFFLKELQVASFYFYFLFFFCILKIVKQMKLCFLEFTKSQEVDLDIMSPGLLTQNLKKKKEKLLLLCQNCHDTLIIKFFDRFVF